MYCFKIYRQDACSTFQACIVNRTKATLFVEVQYTSNLQWLRLGEEKKKNRTRMWANAQPDGRPAEHRWRPLFNAAKFG